MNVPVEDAYFFNAELFLSDTASDWDIVEEAETCKVTTKGVMARWSDDAKGGIYTEIFVVVFTLVFTDGSDCFDGATCSQVG